MQEFSYYSPTKVIFGRGVEQKTAKEIMQWGGSRVFIVYGGGSVVRSGLLEQIEQQCREEGLFYQTFGGVKPNPRLSHAEKGRTEAVNFQADFILAVGGGSVIDTAKGIAHGVAAPDTPLWDFWSGKQEVEKSIPVGCVLTISAAGSETSDSAVLTNEEIGFKGGLNTDFNRPKFAVMNPELTYSLPEYQVACGIVDIMMHTLDRYFTPTEGNELTDEFAEGLLRTTIKNGAVAYADKTDYLSMSELMWCGSNSHNGLTGLGAAKDFVPHKLGHELSAKFDVAHGASLSAVWDSWARYVYQTKPERFARYGENVWGIQENDVDTAAVKAIEKTRDYFRSIDMPVCFTEAEIPVVDDALLMEMANNVTKQGTIKIGSFLPLETKDVYEIFKLANK